jgi:hypothetical protein
LSEIQMNINKTFKSIFVRDDDYTQAIEEWIAGALALYSPGIYYSLI